MAKSQSGRGILVGRRDLDREEPVQDQRNTVQSDKEDGSGFLSTYIQQESDVSFALMLRVVSKQRQVQMRIPGTKGKPASSLNVQRSKDASCWVSGVCLTWKRYLRRRRRE